MSWTYLLSWWPYQTIPMLHQSEKVKHQALNLPKPIQPVRLPPMTISISAKRSSSLERLLQPSRFLSLAAAARACWPLPFSPIPRPWPAPSKHSPPLFLDHPSLPRPRPLPASIHQRGKHWAGLDGGGVHHQGGHRPQVTSIVIMFFFTDLHPAPSLPAFWDWPATSAPPSPP